MRQGSSKGIKNILRTTLSVAGISIAVVASIAAQGGDGRSVKARAKTSAGPSIKRTKLYVPRHVAKRSDPRPKPIEPRSGKLALIVNEAGSSVYLFESGSPADSSPIAITSRPQSLVLRLLPPGSYTVSVKKAGFFDEIRNIDLGAGRRRKLIVSMRPQMAMLTLKTNLADAEIEIENAGKFTRPLRKYFLKPGKYRISVKRRGFISQSVVADLMLAGREQSIYVVLEPLRIDSVLARADELIAKNDLNGAEAFVNDVLLANNSHAKANLLYGMIALHRGDSSAGNYFLKAIKGGATVSIPVKTLFGDKLTEVVIAIDREAIVFKSRAHIDLNFRITRSNLEEFQRLNENDLPAYIAVKGESDFYGREIHPQMKVFPSTSEMDRVSGQVSCGSVTRGRSCSADIDVLFKVVSGWRELSASSSKGASR